MEEYMSMSNYSIENLDKVKKNRGVVTQDLGRIPVEGKPEDIAILITCWDHGHLYDYMQGDPAGTDLPQKLVLLDLISTPYKLHKGDEPQVTSKINYSFSSVDDKSNLKGFSVASSSLNPNIWVVSQTTNLNQTAKGEVEFFFSEEALEFIKANGSNDMLNFEKGTLEQISVKQFEKSLRVKSIFKQGHPNLKKIGELSKKTKTTGSINKLNKKTQEVENASQIYWNPTLEKAGLEQEKISDFLGIPQFVSYCIRSNQSDTQKLLKLMKEYLQDENPYHKELLLGAMNSSDIFPQVIKAINTAKLHKLIIENKEEILNSYITLYSPTPERPLAKAVLEALIIKEQPLTEFPNTIGVMNSLLKQSKIDSNVLNEDHLTFLYAKTHHFLIAMKEENQRRLTYKGTKILLAETMEKISEDLTPFLNAIMNLHPKDRARLNTNFPISDLYLLSKTALHDLPLTDIVELGLNQPDKIEILLTKHKEIFALYKEFDLSFIAIFKDKTQRDYWLNVKISAKSIKKLRNLLELHKKNSSFFEIIIQDPVQRDHWISDGQINYLDQFQKLSELHQKYGPSFLAIYEDKALRDYCHFDSKIFEKFVESYHRNSFSFKAIFNNPALRDYWLTDNRFIDKIEVFRDLLEIHRKFGIYLEGIFNNKALRDYWLAEDRIERESLEMLCELQKTSGPSIETLLENSELRDYWLSNNRLSLNISEFKNLVELHQKHRSSFDAIFNDQKKRNDWLSNDRIIKDIKDLINIISHPEEDPSLPFSEEIDLQDYLKKNHNDKELVIPDKIQQLYSRYHSSFKKIFHDTKQRDYWLLDNRISTNMEEFSLLVQTTSLLEDDKTVNSALNIVSKIKEIFGTIQSISQYSDAALKDLLKFMDFLEDRKPDLFKSLPQLIVLFGDFQDNENLSLKYTLLTALLSIPGQQNPLDILWIKDLLASDLRPHSEKITRASQNITAGLYDTDFLISLSKSHPSPEQAITQLAIKKIKLGTHQIESLGDIDLRTHPTDIAPVNKNETLVIGDLHANPLKLLWILTKTGVLTLDDNPEKKNKLYNELVRIYEKPVEDLTAADLKAFKEIIEHAHITPIACLRLIGDELADRGNNDLFILFLLEKIAKTQELEIILSNHSVEFLKKYKSLGTFTYKDNFRSQDYSFRSLNHLVKKGLVKKEDVIKMVKSSYLPNIKSYGYSVDTSSIKPTLTLAEHAPVGIETLESSAELYEIPEETELLETIDLINVYSSPLLSPLPEYEDLRLDPTTPAIPNYKENSGYRRIWSRGNYDLHEQKNKSEKLYGIDAPAEYRDHNLFLVHGHDGPTSRYKTQYLSEPYDPANPAQSYFPNMINTDNDNGKGQLGGELHYMVSRDTPALQLIKTWKVREDLSAKLNVDLEMVLQHKMQEIRIRYAHNKNIMILMGRIVQTKLKELNADMLKALEPLDHDKIIAAIEKDLNLLDLEKEFENKLKNQPFRSPREGNADAKKSIEGIIDILNHYKGGKKFVDQQIKALKDLQVRLDTYKKPIELQAIQQDLNNIMNTLINEHKSHHESTWILKEYRANKSTLAPLLNRATTLKQDFDLWVDKRATRFEFIPRQYPLALTDQLITRLKHYRGGKDFVGKKITELEKLRENIKNNKPEQFQKIEETLNKIMKEISDGHFKHHDKTWILSDYRMNRSTLAPILKGTETIVADLKEWLRDNTLHDDSKAFKARFTQVQQPVEALSQAPIVGGHH